MSELVDHLIQRGFQDIATIERWTKEETGGFQDEHEYESVVAIKGTNHYKVTLDRLIKYGPGSGAPSFTPSTIQITPEEYRSLRGGRQIEDNDNYRQNLLDREQRQQKNRSRADEIRQTLKNVAPNCPRCSAKLVSKHGSNGYFWGCPRYRQTRCKGSRNMSPKYKRLAKELGEIPIF